MNHHPRSTKRHSEHIKGLNALPESYLLQSSVDERGKGLAVLRPSRELNQGPGSENQRNNNSIITQETTKNGSNYSLPWLTTRHTRHGRNEALRPERLTNYPRRRGGGGWTTKTLLSGTGVYHFVTIILWYTVIIHFPGELNWTLPSSFSKSASRLETYPPRINRKGNRRKRMPRWCPVSTNWPPTHQRPTV